MARCSGGINKLNISPIGEVFPCEAYKWLARRNIRPTIFDFSLEYIWNNDPLLVRLRDKSIPEFCKGCYREDVCGGGCTAQADLCWNKKGLTHWLAKENAKIYNGKYTGLKENLGKEMSVNVDGLFK